MLWDALRKMYDLPRPGKARIRSDDGSPPKCIRPLASGLRLRPGHDEIRAHRSQINGSCRSTFFLELTMRRFGYFVITIPSPLSVPVPPSGDCRIPPFVD